VGWAENLRKLKITYLVEKKNGNDPGEGGSTAPSLLVCLFARAPRESLLFRLREKLFTFPSLQKKVAFYGKSNRILAFFFKTE